MHLTVVQPTLPVCVPDEATELLNRVSGAGLAVQYRFLRKPYIAAPQMIAVELAFQNTTSSAMSSISVGSSQLQSGMKMHSSVFISQLMAGASMNFTIGIDFNDTFQPAKFEVWYVIARLCSLWSRWLQRNALLTHSLCVVFGHCLLVMYVIV